MQQQKPSSWKKNMFDGVFLLGCAVWLFWYFTDFEKSPNHTERINWLIALLYNLGGKWLVCLILLLVSIGEFRAAFRKRGRIG